MTQAEYGRAILQLEYYGEKLGCKGDFDLAIEALRFFNEAQKACSKFFNEAQKACSKDATNEDRLKAMSTRELVREVSAVAGYEGNPEEVEYWYRYNWLRMEEKMTLDEAIKYCEEVAEEQERYFNQDGFESFTVKHKQCAVAHRQLADWLKELKVYKEEVKNE